MSKQPGNTPHREDTPDHEENPDHRHAGGKHGEVVKKRKKDREDDEEEGARPNHVVEPPAGDGAATEEEHSAEDIGQAGSSAGGPAPTQPRAAVLGPKNKREEKDKEGTGATTNQDVERVEVRED